MGQTEARTPNGDVKEVSRAVEERLRLIIDTIPTIVWRKLPDGSADFFNKHFGEYTGLPIEDGLGWGWMKAFHPDDRAMEEWRAALAAGKPFETEVRLRRADGQYRWFLMRAVPQRDEQGNIVKWYGTTSDIEDLKRAEDRIRLIIDTIPTMAWTIRPDGAVDFVNRRWRDYTGLTLQQEIEDPTRVVHPEDLPRVMERWLADMAAGKPSEDEIRLRRADGEYRWFLIRTAPLWDEQGNLSKWYGLSVDIEDRKRAEEELGRVSGELFRVQEEERRKIARDLHDCTAQHLVLLNAALERLQDSIPPQGRKFRRVFSEAQELAALALREVRTLSYLLYPPMLDESGLEDAISHYAEGYTERTGVQVDVQVSPGLGRLGRDNEMALFRVVQESLTNVQRHSGSRRAYIRLNRVQKRVTLEIKDEGRGTVRNAESRRNVPSGVGIPSMRERIKQIGGQLEIESTSAGTTVRATITVDD